MNDIERRLADAMAAHTHDVEPRDEHEALDRITKRVGMRDRRIFAVATVAAALLVAVGTVAFLRRDDNGQHVNVGTTSTSTSTSTTTQPSTPFTVIPAEQQPIWPFASSSTTYATPEAAARSFVVDYLGMTNARLGATNDENGTKNVEVFPNERGTTRTIVRVVEQPPKGWVVFEARADEIQVDTPARNAPLTSPLTISGRASAFESTIGVQLRPFNSTAPVFEGNFMGGSFGELGPFSTSITPPATDQPLVLLLFEGDQRDQGTFTKVTVIALDPAGEAQPSDFVAIRTNGDLVHLDFDGHIQQLIANSISSVANGPGGAIAYTFGGDPCGGTIEVGNLAGSAFTETNGGGRPSLDGSGATIAFVTCNGVDVAAVDGSKRSTVVTDAVVHVVWAAGDTAIVYETADGRLVEQAVGSPNGASPRELTRGRLPALRGRFGTIAFFDGTAIASYNPSTGSTVQLVRPAAKPISLDADASGRHLLWVDQNHDLWKWSGGQPVKVGSGFNSAAW